MKTIDNLVHIEELYNNIIYIYKEKLENLEK